MNRSHHRRSCYQRTPSENCEPERVWWEDIAGPEDVSRGRQDAEDALSDGPDEGLVRHCYLQIAVGDSLLSSR
jgi:hypothetical protein